MAPTRSQPPGRCAYSIASPKPTQRAGTIRGESLVGANALEVSLGRREPQILPSSLQPETPVSECSLCLGLGEGGTW